MIDVPVVERARAIIKRAARRAEQRGCGFGDFQKSLGIAKGMLTTRLRKLVALDILALAPASDGSAYSEYVLTDKGHGLFHVVVSLRQWGESHLFASGENRSRLIDTQRREPVETLELRSKSGRLLTWSDTMVEKVAKNDNVRRRPRRAKKTGDQRE
jgi:DNA-binding HxlR family transcriptional regulator